MPAGGIRAVGIPSARKHPSTPRTALGAAVAVAFNNTHKHNILMATYKNPKWWTQENDSAWERTKAAFKRDWDQTVHDLGGKKPDTNQDVDDTVKQAVGTDAIPPRGQPAYEEEEPAYRFGYGARSHYGKEYRDWDAKVEERLKQDWSDTYPTRKWDADKKAVRRGWDYYK